MTFDEWINAEELTYEAAAKRIGVANASVARRYAKGIQIPEKKIMERIWRATAGKVTANDFYGLSPAPQVVDGLGEEAEVGGEFGREGAGAGGFGQVAQAGDDPLDVVGRVQRGGGQAGDGVTVGGVHG